MAPVEETICGLSQGVTLAVLPRLYVEELVSELKRRNISTESNNGREQLVNILKDVMEQEYHKVEERSNSHLNSVDNDTHQMAQKEAIPVSDIQNTSCSTAGSPTDSTRMTEGNILNSLDILQMPQVEVLPVSDVQETITTSFPADVSQIAEETVHLVLDTTSVSCVELEDAELTLEVVTEEMDQNQDSVESCSSDEDGMTNTVEPDSCDETISCDISSKDNTTVEKMGEREASCESNVQHESSLPNDYESKQEVAIQNSDSTSKKRTHRCDQCSYSSRRKTDIVRHKRSRVHATQKRDDKDKPFKCEECAYSTHRKSDLTRHKKGHTGKMPFRRDQCGYGTVRKSDLVKHVVGHTGSKPFRCDQCDYRTGYKSNVLKYRRSQHSSVSDSSMHNHGDLMLESEEGSSREVQSTEQLQLGHHSNTDSDGNIRVPTEAVSCNTSQEEGKSQGPNTTNSEEDVRSSSTENLEQVGPKASNSGDKLFKCGECTYSTVRKYDLTKHKKGHSGDKPFKCDDCSYSSVRKAELTKHKATHRGEKPLSCEHCSYTTADKSSCHEHKKGSIEEQEPDERNSVSESKEELKPSPQTSDLAKPQRKPESKNYYKCDDCDYSTDRKGDLVRHKLTHTGEKPYSCEQCEYKSADKSNLIKHIRNHSETDQPPGLATAKKPKLQHHQKSDAKSYRCDQCSFSTAWRSSLVQHIKRHDMDRTINNGKKNYVCKACGYRTSHEEKLLKHVENKACKKHFRCTKCDYFTTKRFDLLTHKKSHATTYSCEECSYTTDRSTDLARHKATHTGEKPYLCDLCGFQSADKSNLLKHRHCLQRLWLQHHKEVSYGYAQENPHN